MRDRVGVVLDTATWRASPDWAARRGYSLEQLDAAEEAAAYHSRQAAVFADSGADLITAITMTYPAEAIGVTEAARAAGMPVVISFTVENDGSLPAGQSLAEAIDAVDRATGSYPLYYMVNCGCGPNHHHISAISSEFSTAG